MKALALLLVASVATAAPKKDLERTHKSTSHPAPPVPGTKPAALVNLYNEHTHEWLAVDPRSPAFAGSLSSGPLQPPPNADRFLRDHFTNKQTTMDPHLVPILLAAAANFHVDTVYVVSGFRHPKYNLMLRKKGHQVARDSQHTHGNAIDFYLPNVTTLQLHAWAKAQKLGGVGLYMQSGFVHMDVGPIRYWSGD
ncbi:MAG TPA: DUF882 domain-containing protein [Kofleriaceae bacterium]